jgi:hypothetical protein
MKKAKQAVVADEPMGIVIATGNRGRVVSAPLVRAYYWFAEDQSGTPLTEERSAV